MDLKTVQSLKLPDAQIVKTFNLHRSCIEKLAEKISILEKELNEVKNGE